MRTQSKLVVVFRALVMLSCLIAVPMAAVSGGWLPDLYERVVEKLPSLAQFLDGKAESDGGLPPTAEEAGFATTATLPPTISLGDSIAPDAAFRRPPAEPNAVAPGVVGLAVGQPTGVSAAVVPVAYETPANQPYPATQAIARPETEVARFTGEILAACPNGCPLSQKEVLPANPPPANSHGLRKKAAADPLVRIQNRLRELGATYYRLETLENRSEYRFFCRMALAENSGYLKRFEATHSDPLRAMRQVLEDVECWSAGRRQ